MLGSLPSVLFLDRPFAAGMVHIWLRQYFFELGFNILGGEMPPWKDGVLFDADGAADEGSYLDELDWNEMIRHTMVRLNGRYGYDVQTPEQELSIIRCFKQYAKTLEQQFASDNIKVVVIFGNYRIETKLAAYFCHKYQAQLVCIEGFFLQNYFYLEAGSTQIANHHGFIQKWPYVRNLKITDEQRQYIDKLMYEREHHGLLNDYITMPAPDRGGNKYIQKIQQCRGKVGLLLGQVAYDAVIVNDLKAFPRQIEFLTYIIDSFIAQSDTDDLLVCRLHPLEARYGDHTLQQLKEAYYSHPQLLLLSDDDCNTYQLMRLADFGIVANSQSGLEMIYRDKPVLVCGNPYYAVDNFCLQATDKETIDVQLAKLLSGWTPSQSQLDLAKRYLCSLIFYHLCPRSKSGVKLYLQNIVGINVLLDHNTRRVAKQRQQENLCIMPNAREGKIKISIEYDKLLGQSILVLGIGSFSEWLAEIEGLDIVFASDLPADLQQDMYGKPVHLYQPSLLKQANVILIVWPEEKSQFFLNSLAHSEMADKTFYQIEKYQQQDYCEFRFNQLTICGGKWIDAVPDHQAE